VLRLHLKYLKLSISSRDSGSFFQSRARRMSFCTPSKAVSTLVLSNSGLELGKQLFMLNMCEQLFSNELLQHFQHEAEVGLRTIVVHPVLASSAMGQ
jgi:hypothetical protein